jgi:single-stranded-DNA-specific exonuclease
MPFIPERVSEGYGIKPDTIKKLKKEHKELSLIITVDNGIVAAKAVDAANKLGIDVIISDHHEPGKSLPKAHAIVHTTKISGSGVSWILSREIRKTLKGGSLQGKFGNGLELAAVGTIADILPLTGPNRSIVKFGLDELNQTSRPGLLSLFKDAKLEKGGIGSYAVGFIISPRLNATGRLGHALDSLRLICTTDHSRASDLARQIGKTNYERKKVVEEVVAHALDLSGKQEWEGVVVLAHESYHEGVIGLAASRLVEEFYRPAVVLSKGEKYSKASARSVSGFNLIESIRKVGDIYEEIGGHPMAAGFTIKTSRIEDFMQGLDKIAKPLLSDEVLTKSLKIDLELDFKLLTWDLQKKLAQFEPTGFGNPTPKFATRKVNVLESRTVGFEGRHLKLVFEHDGKVFDAIAFGFGEMATKVLSGTQVDVAYALDENEWNGNKTLQLLVKDIEVGEK